MRDLVKIHLMLLIGLCLTTFTIGCSIKQKPITFEKLSSQDTGVDFSNIIIETDSLNYFKFPYMYMGGGVSVGDINNDGLSDVFFTGNMVPNKLYLNQGSLSFKDISLDAGVAGDNRWFTGVTMVDINNDGWLDIYICASGKTNTTNLLYINNKDLTFSESSGLYGLNDSSPSIQSTFFDYDNDGDLDVYVGNYSLIPLSMGNQYYYKKILQNTHQSSGHLYRNNGDNTFSDVTEVSGVKNFGLTLGIIAADFNNDGWQDLYVSNDFQVPDYFYLNNKDGTFKEVLKESLQHTSMFGMGVDASDFTNDGLIDFAQLDMAPQDYKRSKINMASMDAKRFWNMVDLGWHYQYMQNSLQVNNGFSEAGIPIFSEISRLSGIALTDWSWGVLFADLDNDTKKDIIITNGIRRDVNHNDILNRNKYNLNSEPIKMEDVPSEPLSNYMYHNLGKYKFKDISKKSGFGDEGFSNGIAYGDLDNDGDLDIVVNNLDNEAGLYENTIDNQNNYIRFKVYSSKNNPFGLGTRITISDGETQQMQELTLSRGFQSSVEPILHFGLGKTKLIKVARIDWPDGSSQILHNIKPNQLLIAHKTEDFKKEVLEVPLATNHQKFQDVTRKAGINFKHQENSYNDFEYEPLLPHKNSQVGPGLVVGDVNGDGLEDFFIGNAQGNAGAMFYQSSNSTFEEQTGPWIEDSNYEDIGATLFDPDNDGDLDLYVVSGGNDVNEPAGFYQDRLYINQEGRYIKTTNTLPEINTSGQVVIARDFDFDGDKDLFIGGRIVPGNYPNPARSIILRNEGGKDANLKFKDVTNEVAKDFMELGLVTSALWHDFNNDDWPDLIVTGEWMPIRFFENNKGVFKEVTKELNFENTNGWWYALEAVDVDSDNDLDIVAGNLGLNYKYKTGGDTSFEIYSNDFDENGKSDIVLSYSKKGKQLPVRGRECSSQQVPAISKRFETYKAFANADLIDIYGNAMLDRSLKYKAKTFAHHWIENRGSGEFVMHELPTKSQFSSVNDIEVLEGNNDGFPNLLLAGNIYGSEVETPRNDSGIGLVLENDKSKHFKSQSLFQNGLYVRGEVKAIKSIKLGKSQTKGYLFAVNNDSLKLLVKHQK
ncbi:MAG: VCBS repeat-containing protein [Flavobacteriaceae bacterium]|nr:VCBS repeat-containing protein [Flavobacteriaceae bacterium]